jgi:hemerythrin HHE cation binding domain-containing protein
MPNPIQNAVAKVAGKAAGVEARLKGLKGVFAKLAEQHHEAGALLGSTESATDHTKRRELWQQVRKELMSHEQGELLEIYPVLEGYDATREIARRHADHASELEGLIRQVDAIGVQSDAWRPALERLIAKVKEHVEKEETEFFPRAQEALGDDAARQLEKPFLRAQEMAKERLA